MSDAGRVNAKPEETGEQAAKSGNHAKTARVAAWLPRAMRVEQAAMYLSMSRSMFLKLVEDRVMPEPVKIRGMTTWDRFDLDDAFEELKLGNGEPSENTVHRRLRELADGRRKHPI